MKKLLFTMFAILALSAVAMAAPSTCAATDLAAYLTPGFSCTEGNLLFSNWSYSPSANPSGDSIPATSIEVTPTDLLIPGLDGVQFTSGWSVTSSNGTNFFQDSDISFTVSTLNGAATLDDMTLSFNGSSSNTGSAGVTENYCLGGKLATCGVLGQPGVSGQVTVTPASFTNGAQFGNLTAPSA